MQDNSYHKPFKVPANVIGTIIEKFIITINERKALMFLDLAEEWGKPKDRIYKWLKGKGVPKADDQADIIKWIEAKDWKKIHQKSESSGNLLEESEHNLQLPPTEEIQAKYIRLLEQQNASLQKTLESDLAEQLAKKNVTLLQSFESSLSKALDKQNASLLREFKKIADASLSELVTSTKAASCSSADGS